MSGPLLLDNPVRGYAWGSRTVIAQLQGRAAPSPTPEAELWMGAHPGSPSRVLPAGQGLDERIAADPVGELGPRVAGRFGPRLPFLMKVLAAAAPLSLQAHPSPAQAEEGYAREEAAGLALDDPTRSYKDDSHKPELICALTPFTALCGFRPIAATRRLLAGLGVPRLDKLAAGLAEQAPGEGDGGESPALRELFASLVTLSGDDRRVLLQQVFAACRNDSGDPEFAAERAWVARLARDYPADIGVVAALLLNLVELAPMEAVYLPAGNLHAYLGGVGIEIMASSDNVLRGGLTPKHVDVAELLKVLRFTPGPVPVLRPRRVGPEEVFDAPAQEFRLSRVIIGDGSPVDLAGDGPQVLLCIDGSVTVVSDGVGVELVKGSSAYVPACASGTTVSGAGTVFRATVPG
jgi:mannose-6-phosphate isomerase